MPDIFHDFPIRASAKQVFQGISTPAGLDTWWTERSSGEPVLGSEYDLWFGPQYNWRAIVTGCAPDTDFELRFTSADADWVGTRVGFTLVENQGVTGVRFHHTGWPRETENYRGSCYCWAMYLRLLKRYVETGEVVAYAKRLDA
ncbi:MAG: SRPBCC domain-containing protein [Bryobacteraceae bacterium]|jgi:uncharacterized protein YndB with AHSA1/START domain